MGKNKPLRDGLKIYDTPRRDANCKNEYEVYSGYDGGFGEIHCVESCRCLLPNTAKWERIIVQDILSGWKIKYPENWDMNFVNFVLIRNGWIIVFRDPSPKSLGVIALPGGISGRNVYYQPTKTLIANPCITGKQEFRIGEDCEILHITNDWGGLWDKIHADAEQLASLELSVHTATINNRAAFAIAATSEASKETIRRWFDLIEHGKPMVVTDTALFNDRRNGMDETGTTPWQTWTNPVGSNYIVDKAISDLIRYYDFVRERYGIPALSEKKERRITGEIDTINAISQISPEQMQACFNRSFENVIKLFPELNGQLEWKLKTFGGEYNDITRDLHTRT